jgi:asparagine synthase (glutamine-hydrolysing)
MCGISGYWGDLPAGKAIALLQAMNASLAHRGPDGEGLWIGPQVGFAHRRLAIIDIASGAQPMASADGRYRIIFNGEIYNHRPMRDELTKVGYKFLTRSDTEVIPAAIDWWGIEDGLSKLRGMFAFALYDLQDNSLLMARDPFGIKPLYVGYAPGLILFSSEPKAMLTYDGLNRRGDPIALLDFFALGAALSPRTCWSAIRELEPGSWLRFTPEGESHGRFWDWSCAMGEPLTEEEAIEQLESVLTDSLRVHLESDVPVAAFLSGGIDSSLLVALLSRHLVPALHTFNVGFDEVEYDESVHARAVASRYGTKHHESRILTGEGTPELFQSIVEQYDQPFGDSSCLPTWIICKEMAQHTKVVISGDGGDEMFGGYPRYVTALQLAALGKIPLLPTLVGMAGYLMTWIHPNAGSQLQKVSTYARMPREQMLCALNTHFFKTAEMRTLFRPEFLRQALVDGHTYERFASYIPTGVSDACEQLMAAELHSLLHYDFLRKVDVASSAHGLEVRTPFLDVEVFNLAARLPRRMKVRPKSLKHISRLLARRLLPDSVVDRPKQGFTIPFDRWASPQLREFLRELLGSPSAQCRDWFQPGAIDTILDVFFGRSRSIHLSRVRAYYKVFSLASFELWLRKWSPVLP